MAHLDTNSNQQQSQTEILEYEDIYFFYRPKVRSEQGSSKTQLNHYLWS